MENMSPEEYIDLTIKMMSKMMEIMAEKISEKMSEIEKEGPQKAMQILMQILQELRVEIGKQLLPEGISDEDMENYKKEHETEIKEYLETNQEIKEKLEKLEKEFGEKLKFK